MRKNCLTEGNVWKQIILFALPLLGASFIQQLYNTVDLWFAGNKIADDTATASVGASSMMVTCIVGFFTGISTGISVIVSHAVGSKDYKKVENIICTAIGVSVVGGILLTILGISFSSTFLTLMKTPKKIFDSSLTYIRVYTLSMVFIVTYNVTSGIIRALGNSNVPLIIQTIGGVTNVIMDFLSVEVCHLGISGIAWATMFSQGISAILSVTYLTSYSKDYRLYLKKVRIHGDILKDIFRVGIPAGLQSLIITLSNVFVQYKINSFDDVNSISAFAVYFKVELLIYLPIVALGQAMMTFTGQNIGANKTDRVKYGIVVCIVIGIVYAVIAGTLLLTFGDRVFATFDDNPKVISCGLRIIKVTFPLYFIYVVLEVFADTIRGTGNSLSPMVIIMLNICGVRTLLLATFTHISPTVESIAMVYPISWATASITFVIYYFKVTKKFFK